MRRFPLWKHALVAVAVIAAVLYALPSFYAKSPTVQVRSAKTSSPADIKTLRAVRSALRKADIATDGLALQDGVIQAVFADSDSQIAARSLLAAKLGRDFVVALNADTKAPPWLASIGASPLALGLDLRGGVYFLLQADLEFASQKRLRGIVGELRASMANIAVRSISVNGDTIVLETESVEAASAALEVVERTVPDLQTPSDASTIMRFSLSDAAVDEIVDLTMEQNLQTLRNRVNELGVAEPVITRQGRDRVAVQLPGVQDTAQAKSVLGRTAALELRGVDEQKTASASLMRRAKKGRIPAGTELFANRDGGDLLLETDVVVSGENITDARPGFDNNNRPAVHISLDSEGAERIKRYTRPRVGQRLAILLRDRDSAEVISAPVVQQELYANFIIHGRMSSAEAAELSLLLRAGALAAPLEIVEERTIGPSLGADNIRRGVNSVIGGFIAIAIFIIFYYAVFGMISVTALLANVMLLTAFLGGVGATLTLPGLAGFALTLGMAIDANVLINERIREETDSGKTPQAAVEAGYGRAFTTILDSNLTTLIAGLALFAFGSGPVRGFAVVLCFGILTSMFCAINASRSLVNISYERGKARRLSLGFRLLNLKRTLSLMRWRKLTGALSAIFLVICIGSLGLRGLNFGVDFTGGSVIEVAFPEQPEIAKVRAKVADMGLEGVPIQQSGDGLVIIKAPPASEGAQLSERLLDAMRELDGGAAFRRVEFVGPQVSEELFISGALALLVVLLGIAAYLSMRFKWRMAVGAIVANLHDIVFILGLFSIFQWEFSLPVLAAILAILGYSVNESVVIFDRVRENSRNSRKGADAADILDAAITQTWARTIITHGSTQLAVLAMLFFGGDALFLFALALTIGIFSSIYSSVLIAGPVALRLGLSREDFIEDPSLKADNPAGAVV